MFTQLHPHTLQRFGLSLVMALVLSVVSPTAYAESVSLTAPRDCDSSAIIKCGALSSDELAKAYATDKYVQQTYGYFGLDAGFSQTLSTGSVDRQGNVYADGKSAPVAKNTQLVTRGAAKGSQHLKNGSAEFYAQPLNGNLSDASAKAFVLVNKDGFVAAIVASNGDLVVPQPAKAAQNLGPAPAQPAPAATAPAPMATPTPTATSNQAAPASSGGQTALTNTGPMGSAMTVAVLTAAAAGSGGAYAYRLRKLNGSVRGA